MDHNEFDFFHEFSEPLLDFISRNAIFAYTENCNPEFSGELFKVPEEFKSPPKNWKTTYQMKSLPDNFLEINIASDTAGLTWHPDTLPTE